MSVQRVLVVGEGSLLDAGIAHVLSQEPELEITTIASEDVTTWKEEIERLRPDIVVMDEVAHRADGTRWPSRLVSDSEPRVVVVSADSNLVLIYEGHQVPIRQATDLVDIVRRLGEQP